jgi:SAM-dependent methyltransferase
MLTSPEVYNKEYFENGLEIGISGYENYHWIPEKTLKEAKAIIRLLSIKKEDSVLDFGCAKGFLVRALRDCSINAYGCDISKYALENADELAKPYLKESYSNKFDFIVSRNTLEHLTEQELRYYMNYFSQLSNTIFFTVPLCEKDGGEYILPIPFDITHKIKWTKHTWIKFCKRLGWRVEFRNQVKGIHTNWKEYKEGNGFFVLRK